jgi:hypothetical protein
MVEFLKWLVTGVIPPRESDEDALYKWQVAVATAIIVWSLFIIGTTAMAFGFAKPIFPGFALSTSVDSTNKVLAQVLDGQRKDQLRTIDSQIFQLLERKCKNEGETPVNAEAMRLIREKINDLMNDYEELSGGTSYRLLTCSQL